MANKQASMNDLNSYLFDALDKLSDEGLTDEELEKEINRANAITKVAEAATKNHKIRSGRTGRIEKGHVPWNKGKPFDCPGREATQFKKGQMPHNYHPVGTEVVRTDGYLQVKVADPKTWKLKHHLVWEEANGPIPKGHMIVFLNQDKTDTRLENLKLVKRSLMAIANKNGLIREDAEHTKTGLLIAEVKQAAFRAKKNKKKPASYETMYRDDFSAGKGLLDEELS